MKIEIFEDIQCWQKSKALTVDLYSIFKKNKDYAFRDQIQKVAVSIMNNISEGFERNTNKEFRQFLFIAKGSCGEVRSMLYLAKDLTYISKSQFDDLRKHTLEISKMLSGFIKTL